MKLNVSLTSTNDQLTFRLLCPWRKIIVSNIHRKICGLRKPGHLGDGKPCCPWVEWCLIKRDIVSTLGCFKLEALYSLWLNFVLVTINVDSYAGISTSDLCLMKVQDGK
jgi:hypothetical protein